MIEKRFKAVDGGFKHIIEDKEQRRVYLMHIYEHNQKVADLLNEQQATIQSLKEENIELKNLRKYCAEWMGVKEENLYDVVR